MCFHNAMSKTALEAENRYGATFRERSLFSPIYHGSGFTYMKWPVITQQTPQIIDLFNWGLIPHWVKGSEEAAKIRSMTLNAQGETLFEKPSFKHAASSTRCLVLSTGFFEWMHLNKQKYPHFVYAPEFPVFSMGGIYSTWHDAQTGQTTQTFSIVTTPANKLMEEIHNTKKRMPLILTPDEEKLWLSADISDNDIKLLFKPAADAMLSAHTVSPLIGNMAKNTNIPEVQKLYHYSAFNTLF